MSWGTEKKGALDAVVEHVAEAIIKSASYDETLAPKADGVADATENLIRSAAIDVPDGKEVEVHSFGHLDHNGLSTYGLKIDFVDPDPMPTPE